MKKLLLTTLIVSGLAACSSTAPLAPGKQELYNKGPVTKQVSEYIEYDYYTGTLDRITGVFREKKIVEIRVRGVAPVQSGTANNLRNSSVAAKAYALDTLSDFLCSTNVSTQRTVRDNSRFNETGTDKKTNKISSNFGEDKSEAGSETNVSDRRDILNAVSESNQLIRTSNQCRVRNIEWKSGEVTDKQFTIYLVWNREGATAARGVHSHMNR